MLNDHVDLSAFPHFDREMTGLHESQSRPGCVILGLMKITIMGL